MTKVTQKHLWQTVSISAFCYLPGGNKKPSSGRKGDHEVVEGARVTLNLDILRCNALSLSRLRRHAPQRTLCVL